MKILTVIAISSGLFLIGCTPVTYDAYNTYPKKRACNGAVDTDSNTKDTSNGYIIGIEKRKVREVSDISKEACLYRKGHNKETDLLEGNAYSCVYNHKYKDDLDGRNNLDKYYLKKLSNEKVMLVTHIFDTNVAKPAIYNPYECGQTPRLNFNEGYTQLTESFSKHLKNNLEKGGYTHVFVVMMGWHNDQEVSLQRVNKIVSNLKKIREDKKGPKFKPLTIAVTWPSSWFSASSKFMDALGHLPSYTNKTNDADELGFTLLNTLINQVIPRAMGEIPLKLSWS